MQKHFHTDGATLSKATSSFDHLLALSAKKHRERFIYSVLSKQVNCVNMAKRQNVRIHAAFNWLI